MPAARQNRFRRIRIAAQWRVAGKTRAYTLVETLVASSILMIGVSAAASMSLSFVTQEEISERSVRAFNHLENAAALLHAGVDPSRIPEILPPDPVVTSLVFSSGALAATNLGNVPSTVVTVTYRPTAASEQSGAARWTGGSSDAVRTASVEIVRTNPTLAAPLPRVDFFD